MSKCTRRGCGKEFDAADNVQGACEYHPGSPVFHEGLKSWSCCNELPGSKPVLEFDEFMKIPACTSGVHTVEALQVEAPKQAPTKAPVKSSDGATETYGSGPSTVALVPSVPTPAPAPAPVVIQEDDHSIPVSAGTTCKRTGCDVAFVSDEVNRHGEGEGTVCHFHPSPPIFREGSKGYLCCKRRVLEFDEFLKIGGCKQGKHLFAPEVNADAVEELTDCRVDHYQTLTEVHVSVFAKKADKERSIVTIEDHQISFDLFLPGPKRFTKTIELFGPVDASTSSFKFFGTKVEVLLKKQDTRSWTVLEKTEHNLGNIQLTFGVGGRTGTTGAK